MKLCKTEEAVGQILYHDITQIIPGIVKDAVFRKGHVIKEEDIPVLFYIISIFSLRSLCFYLHIEIHHI